MSFRSPTNLLSDPQVLKNRFSEENLSIEALSLRIDTYLKNKNKNFIFNQSSGAVINSKTWADYINDEKFYANDLNSSVSSLSALVENFSSESFNYLKAIENKILNLDADLIEAAIKNDENAEVVHFNSFVRDIDLGLGKNIKSWNLDPKNNLRFASKEVCHEIVGTGLTLPIDSDNNIFISDIKLVGELTDVGDTVHPIFSNSPRVLLNNETFRHVVLRKDFDATSKNYKQKQSTIGLQLDFAFPQLVNYIDLETISETDIIIDSIFYTNLSNENVYFGIQSYESLSLLKVMFEPIMAKSITLVLTQRAPIDKSVYEVKDYKIDQLNKLLAGLGLNIHFETNEELISGRLFDFSLKKVKVGLFSYLANGVFRSKPIEIKDPKALSFVLQEEILNVSSVQNSGKIINLPFNPVATEKYLALTLYNENNKLAFRDAIPVPDSDEYSVEKLIINNDNSRTKLFPNLLYATEYRFVLFTEVTSDAVVVTLSQAHNLTAPTRVSFYSSNEDGFSGTFVCRPSSPNQLIFYPLTSTSNYLIDKSLQPKILAILSTDQMPFEIYQEGVLLEIKKDYLISIDSGRTFLDYIPYELYYKNDNFVASDFRIKFKAPRIDNQYYILYKYKRNQWLLENKLIKLKNGAVLLEDKLQNTHGNIHSVIILRSITNNKYLSSLVKYYVLKVY